MDEATASGEVEVQVTGAGDGDPRVTRARRVAAGDTGRELLEHVAEGASLSSEEERSALDWLLGAPVPTVHDITVRYETPEGEMKRLTFVARKIDGRKIDTIEAKNIDRGNGTIDRLSADKEIIAEACTELKDGKRTVTLKSDEFLTVTRVTPEGMTQFRHASPAEALAERFRDQIGVLTTVAMEIKRAAGFSPDRLVGTERRLVKAALD